MYTIVDNIASHEGKLNFCFRNCSISRPLPSYIVFVAERNDDIRDRKSELPNTGGIYSETYRA
jgi:hypothetical protein